MRSSILNSCFVITILSVVVSCATMQPPPKYEPSQFSMSKRLGGIKVFLEPFNNNETVIKYFGANLIESGVFPFYVKISNQSKDNSLYIDGKTFSLASAMADDGVDGSSGDHRENADGAGVAGVAGAVLLSPVLLLAGGKMLTDASVINYSVNQNRLQPTTLSPGKEVSGFVYFSLPRKGEIPKNWSVTVSIESLTGGENVDFRFDLEE